MFKRTLAAAVLVTGLGGLSAGSEPPTAPNAQLGAVVAAVTDANRQDCVVVGALVGGLLGGLGGGPLGAVGGAILGAY